MARPSPSEVAVAVALHRVQTRYLRESLKERELVALLSLAVGGILIVILERESAGLTPKCRVGIEQSAMGEQ